MRKIMIWGSVMMLISATTFAQKIDEQRMERDMQVAENVLSTLLRQQFDKQKMFFPLEVKGNYQPGYGATFRLPADVTTPIVFSFDDENHDMVWNVPPVPPVPGIYSYSNKVRRFHLDENELAEMQENQEEAERQEEKEVVRLEEIEKREEAVENRKEDVENRKNLSNRKDADDHQVVIVKTKTFKSKEDLSKDKSKMSKDRLKASHDKLKERKKTNLDSIRNIYNNKMIEAAKNFIADYGDLISQLAPEERIIITNQGEQPRMWVGKLVNAPNRTHLSIEALKADLTLHRQGKLTRDQLVSRIKVINTETVDTVEPDLELLSSIFDRLYQPDLAQTYFTEDKTYYERLKDYGVVYYMQVYSSNQHENFISMPTLKLEDIDQETRNNKVKELYPAFEKEIKENILEYGRTLKSLKDNEILAFNIRITRCAGCGIPSTLELSIKGSSLKDYGSGKLDKDNALARFTTKKGSNQ